MVEAVSILTGAVLTILVGLLRRKYKVSRGMINSIVLVCSFLIAFLVRYIETGEYAVTVEGVGLIYASSQVVYQLIIKQFELEDRLEGVK